MAVRNFYVSADIDGRKTRLGSGPSTKLGGMDLTLTVRHEGDIIEAAEIRCRADAEGNLRCTVEACRDALRRGLVITHTDEGESGFTIRTRR